MNNILVPDQKLINIAKECKIQKTLLNKYLKEDDCQERFIFEFERNNLLTSKNIKILNIGAGRGGLSCALSKKGFVVDNVEYSKCYSRIIEWKYEKYNYSGYVKNMPIEEFNTNNLYDFAIMTDVIEHVQDPEKTLISVNRLLKKDGKTYITVPTRFHLIDPHYKMPFICFIPNSWADKLLKLFGKNKTHKDAGKQTLSEMHYYTYSKFCKLAKKNGFDIIDIRKREILDPDTYFYAKNASKYDRTIKTLKKVKMSGLLIPFSRTFFGHKFILVKKRNL